jgi:aryl-alcohol dehydrogenase-like predicted oxidoreductase
VNARRVFPRFRVAGPVRRAKIAASSARECRAPAEKGARAEFNQARVNESNLAIAAEVKRIAAEIGRSSSQVALAWVRAQDPSIIPIIGARKLSQLQDNLGCLEVDLTHAHLARLDAVSRVDLGFPMEFLRPPFIRGLLHGENWDKIAR